MPDSQEPDGVFEPERYELSEARRYRFDFSRRDFLGVTGAGLLILATDGDAAAQNTREKDSVSARLHIATDGAITILTSKVEVGGFAHPAHQAAAEELRVPIDQIRLVMADQRWVPTTAAPPAAAPRPAGSGGSSGRRRRREILSTWPGSTGEPTSPSLNSRKRQSHRSPPSGKDSLLRRPREGRRHRAQN